MTRRRHLLAPPAKVNVGDGIVASPSSFVFDRSVAQRFDRHVAASVPLYGHATLLLACFSDHFVRAGSRVLDVGCSTGNVSVAIARRHRALGLHHVLVDRSPDMVDVARRRVGRSAEMIAGDFLDLPDVGREGTFDFAVAAYLFNFLTTKGREDAAAKIRRWLAPGGAAVFVDRFEPTTPTAERIFREVHDDLKVSLGHTSAEVRAKQIALRGVFRTRPRSEFESVLLRAGFRGSDVFWTWCGFSGILATT